RGRARPPARRSPAPPRSRRGPPARALPSPLRKRGYPWLLLGSRGDGRVRPRCGRRASGGAPATAPGPRKELRRRRVHRRQHTRVSAYDAIARLYDPWSRTVVEDVGFYVEEAVRSGGPVLELGVGTGRIAVPTAAAGVEVVGVD